MKNSLIVLFLLFATPCFAGDFVCGEGTAISKRISCGAVCSNDSKCVRVDREQSIVNKKLEDGKLLDLTQEELDVIASAKAFADAEAEKQVTLDKLIAVLQDKEVLTKTEVETKEIVDVKEIVK